MIKILLPIDGSTAALAAVKHVLRLIADGLSAEAVLLNVQEPPSLYEVVTVHDAEVLRHLRSDAGADLLAPAEALLTAAGVTWQSEVAGGQPGPLLVDLLENYGCDAVVMGAQGVGDPEATDLGSVAGWLVRHSPVPVTLLRADAVVETAVGLAEDSGG